MSADVWGPVGARPRAMGERRGAGRRRALRYLRAFAPYPLRQWRLLLVVVTASALSAAVSAALPWPLKFLADNAFGSHGVPAALHSILAGLSLRPTAAVLVVVAALGTILLYAMSIGLEVLLTWAWTLTGQRMMYGLAGDMFHRLQRLSLGLHARRPVGDSLTRLSVDTWSIYIAVEGGLVSPVQQLLTLAVVGTVAVRLDPVLGLLTLGLAPCSAVVARWFGRRVKERATERQEAQSMIASFVQQTLHAMPIVQAFTAEGRNARRFRHLADDAVGAVQRTMAFRSALGFADSTVAAFGTAVILFVGSERVLSGALSVGSLLAFIAYLQTLQGLSQSMLDTYAGLKEASASLERVLEVLEAEGDVTDRPGAAAFRERPAGHVRFRGVSFGYGRDRPVLRWVSLEARPGETVALVGRTGAGKSTLVSMIPRFYDPWAGLVTIDGLDVRRVKLASLRRQVAVVLQEPFLLPLSVAENIAYGRPGAPASRIQEAAEVANAHGFISRLPQGYDTVIGEAGATLSGGERQRLAIARAVLKDAPIVILDEPTSALDAETETLVMEALERLTEGRTTFLIAHRLSTARRADRIAVLDRGEVVEFGAHDELMAAGGPYQRLCSLQLDPAALTPSTTGAGRRPPVRARASLGGRG